MINRLMVSADDLGLLRLFVLLRAAKGVFLKRASSPNSNDAGSTELREQYFTGCFRLCLPGGSSG